MKIRKNYGYILLGALLTFVFYGMYHNWIQSFIMAFLFGFAIFLIEEGER